VVDWRNRNGSPAPTKAPPLLRDNTEVPGRSEMPARRDNMDDVIPF
jgi:hypothetical protein